MLVLYHPQDDLLITSLLNSTIMETRTPSKSYLNPNHLNHIALFSSN